MDKKVFIETVSQRIQNGKCEAFIGSGISSGAGVVSWKELLEPLAKNIGIIIKDEDDLPMIAQYIVNENSGNENIIRTRLVENFEKDFTCTSNHIALVKMNFKRIWTTNYDTLIEKALHSNRYNVVSNDDDLSRPRNKSEEIEIIKIHGDIKGKLDDIVLTQQNYDNILFNKPAIAQRLRNTLLNNSILFLGYGYRDPDIRTITIEAMKLMNNHTQEHFIILLDIQQNLEENEADFKQRKLRFSLWIKELNRIGIRELIIQSKSELMNVLDEIALKSKGRTIFITGSHEESCKSIKEVSKKLVEIKDVILVNGQSAGVGMAVINSFMEECIKRNMDISEKIRIYPNPYAANPEYSNKVELISLLKSARNIMFKSVKVFVFFEGGMGTKVELDLAIENKCMIIPGILKDNDYENENIKLFLENEMLMDKIKDTDLDYYNKLKEKQIPIVDDIIKIIQRAI